MNKVSRQDRGRWGEALAVRYLEGRGFRIHARNFRTPWGELDIIAQQGRCLCFIEVKTRSSEGFGQAQEAVTLEKQGRMVRSAQVYLRALGRTGLTLRFDVIAIRLAPAGPPEVEYFPAAFEVPES